MSRAKEREGRENVIGSGERGRVREKRVRTRHIERLKAGKSGREQWMGVRGGGGSIRKSGLKRKHVHARFSVNQALERAERGLVERSLCSSREMRMPSSKKV